MRLYQQISHHSVKIMDEERDERDERQHNDGENYRDDFLSPEDMIIREMEELDLEGTSIRNNQDYLQKNLQSEVRSLTHKAFELKRVVTEIQRSIELKAQKQPSNGNLEVPTFFIEKIKVLKPEQDEKDRVINKLKVMCCKNLMLPRENTSLEYICHQPPYIERIKTLQAGVLHFDDNIDRVSKQLQKIKKKFKIIHPNFIHFYRHHPMKFVPELLPTFYISFYNEHLLFFNGEPIKMKSNNILYCPIFVVDGPSKEKRKIEKIVSISQFYLNELKMDNLVWEHYSLIMIFRGCKDFEGGDKIARISACKDQKHHLDHDERDFVTFLLKKIRGYVYLKTIWNWICFMVGQKRVSRQRNSITMDLGDGITFQLTTVNIRSQPKQSNNNRSSSLSSNHDPNFRNNRNNNNQNNSGNMNMNRRDSMRENQHFKKDDPFQKSITRDFLSFFSAKKFKEFREPKMKRRDEHQLQPQQEIKSKEEWQNQLKNMLRYNLKRAVAYSKQMQMEEYDRLCKYYYQGDKRKGL